MQKIEAFAQAAGLLGAQLRRGVVTNSFLTAADCDREARTGLYVYEANGELLVFRDRGTHYILNFFLQQGAHPTLPDVSKPVVTELAYRPKDAARHSPATLPPLSAAQGCRAMRQENYSNSLLSTATST